MTFNILLLTGEQIRAARALARIEQTELARRAGLSLETIKRLERIRGPVEANARTLRAIQRAFELIGIRFHGDDDGTVGVARFPLEATASGGLSVTQSVDPKQSAPNSLPRSEAQRLRRVVYYGNLKDVLGDGLRLTLSQLHAKLGTLNRDLGLTGISLVLDGKVLQAIEGEQEAVEIGFQRLRACGYHDRLSLLDDRPAGQRIFSDMGFCCGNFPSDIQSFSEHPGFGLPFHPETLTGTEAIALLMAASRRQQEMPRNGCLIPASCTLAASCLERRCSDPYKDEALNLTVRGN